jgi:hypothetical protein
MKSGQENRGRREKQEMGVSFKHGFALSAVGAVLFISSGCMAPVAFQAAGAIGGASPVAMNLVEKGKAESYWVARYADVVDATIRAGQVLSLELLEKKVAADKTSFRYGYSKGEKAEILVEYRTATMTSVQIDYGVSGSMAFARLMGREIAVELAKADAFLEDLSPDEDTVEGAEEI